MRQLTWVYLFLGGSWNEQFEVRDSEVSVKGILMNQLINNIPCTYAVSSVFNVSKFLNSVHM